MNIHFLSAAEGQVSLASFASKLFSTLGIHFYEERESENYDDGHYFKGSDGHLVFKIALSDESDPEIFPYWVNIAASMHTQNDLVEFIIHLIREKLSPAGFHFVCLESFGKINESRVEC